MDYTTSYIAAYGIISLFLLAGIAGQVWIIRNV